jgi:hypothetical protein
VTPEMEQLAASTQGVEAREVRPEIDPYSSSGLVFGGEEQANARGARG